LIRRAYVNLGGVPALRALHDHRFHLSNERFLSAGESRELVRVDVNVEPAIASRD
jgi:hypothetical protein